MKKSVLALAIAMVIAIPLGLVACGGGGTDGESLAKGCTSGCHGYDRIEDASYKTEAEWDKSLTSMENLGWKPGSPEERQLILDYLVEQSN